MPEGDINSMWNGDHGEATLGHSEELGFSGGRALCGVT